MRPELTSPDSAILWDGLTGDPFDRSPLCHARAGSARYGPAFLLDRPFLSGMMSDDQASRGENVSSQLHFAPSRGVLDLLASSTSLELPGLICAHLSLSLRGVGAPLQVLVR